MPKVHIVPTHVRLPETVLTIGGVPLSARQFLLLLQGCALGYDLWLHGTALARLPAGPLVRLLLSVLPVVASALLAFLRLAGRDLLAWIVVLLRYGNRPHRLIWRSIRFLEPSLVLAGEEERDG